MKAYVQNDQTLDQLGHVVVEEGMAEVINSDVQAATAAAERVALCKAVARRIGVDIHSTRVTDNAEALINIIRTHITGSAKILETLEKWTDEDNYRHVRIRAYVSPAITPEGMERVESAPLFLLLDMEIEDHRPKDNSGAEARDPNELYAGIIRQMMAKIRELLTKEGYQIIPLPDDLSKGLKGLLSNSNSTGIDNWYLSELAGAAGIFITGEARILLRTADILGFQRIMYAVECDTDLKIMQNNQLTGLNTILWEKFTSERGMHPRIRQAIRYAIDDTVGSMKSSPDPNLFGILEERVGVPNRLLYLYVVGLSSADEYNELQDYLRQKLSPFFVDVRGVRFNSQKIDGVDWNASKIILAFSNQIEDKFSDVVDQVALTIDNIPDYKVLKRTSRTIILNK